MKIGTFSLVLLLVASTLDVVYSAREVIPLVKTQPRRARSQQSNENSIMMSMLEDSQTVQSEIAPYAMYTKINENEDALMAVLLYSSQSFRVKSCKGFTSAKCENDKYCNVSSTSSSQSFPFMTISGKKMTESIYLNPNSERSLYNWGARRLTGIYADDCDVTEGYDNEIQGAIGFGINPDKEKRFRKYKQFAVQITEDGNATLVFSDDSFFTDSHLEAGIESGITRDWEIAIVKTFVGETNYKTRTAIFDLSIDYIGLPADLYDEVISFLEDYDIKCEKQIKTTLPKCNVTQKFDKLPSLLLYATEIDKITFAPKVYLKEVEEGIYTLMLGKLLNNTKDDDGVYVTKKYQNHIILGTRYMSFFYPVFDLSEPHYLNINIFKVNTGFFSEKSNIIFTGIIVIIGWFFLVSMFKLCRARSQYKTDLLVSDPDQERKYSRIDEQEEDDDFPKKMSKSAKRRLSRDISAQDINTN